MQISAVIPTCNRKQRLLSLLGCLDQSIYPLLEVIIVDAGEDRLVPADLSPFTNLSIRYLSSEKSVCIQRNLGIQKAIAPWIFLCDDDMEVPTDYLMKLTGHLQMHEDAGAVSGVVMQKENGHWQGKYPIHSPFELCWKFIFQLSIWGEIECPDRNLLISRIKRYYQRKGNHLSRAGWPVITDFSGDYFISPIYGLGASLVKKDWLIRSPYDEVLDRHGIGDNYGVAVGFPTMSIHIVNKAPIFHHQEQVNRLNRSLQYRRRALALDYFIRTRQELRFIKKRWLLWSLTGNLLSFVFARDARMIRTALTSLQAIAFGHNPYYSAALHKRRVIEP